MIGRLIKYFLLAPVAVGLLGGAYVYLFSPTAEVAAAFAQYKAAMLSGDGPEFVRLTAPPALDFIEAQRQRALHAGRDELIALGFRERMTIFGLRAVVHRGMISVEDMQAASRETFYARAQAYHPTGNASLDKITLIMVVPMGQGHARGYLDLTGQPDPGIGTWMISLFHGLRFDFALAGGQWLVDPTPLLEASATQNEWLAHQMDATGNQLIFKMLGIPDAERDKYWQPLLSQT